MKMLLLTESGKEYADELMNELFSVEQAAFLETLKRYDGGFVNAMSFFADELARQTLH